MNGLRRLTLICHFISLIQQPPRALSVQRQSLSPSRRTPISSTSASSASFSSCTAATRVRLEHPPHPRPACVPPNQLFRRGSKKKKEGESERGGEEGGREREGGRKKKNGGWERGSERKCERERGKLGLDEKMLRPVALHTRGHQIKSLVVSPAHPSVRSRASERKIKKIKKEKRTERGSEREKKRERPAGGGGAFMVYLGARGTFYRKRHRFFRDALSTVDGYRRVAASEFESAVSRCNMCNDSLHLSRKMLINIV